MILDFYKKWNSGAKCDALKIITFLKYKIESIKIIEIMKISPKGYEVKWTYSQSNQTYHRCYSKLKNIYSIKHIYKKY